PSAAIRSSRQRGAWSSATTSSTQGQRAIIAAYGLRVSSTMRSPAWCARRSRRAPSASSRSPRAPSLTTSTAAIAVASGRDRRRVLARGQELDRGRALLCQLQVDPGRREVDQFAGRIDREVLRVLLAELLELAFVVAADPARGGDLYRLEHRLDPVFVLQPVRGHVELQRADRAQHQVVGHQRAEELGRAFLAELGQALVQLLELERVAQARAAEKFRREVGDAGERQRLAFGEAVADRDRAVVVDADDVAGVGALGDLAVAG